MSVMKAFYEITYRYFQAPWDIGPREELVALVESRHLKPCRVIDLGCGTGANAIYLAQKCFDVTGVDYAEAAIDKARGRARDSGVHVDFIVDDLTKLRHVSGVFDFLLDYGVPDDLRPHQREPYLHNMLPLTHPVPAICCGASNIRCAGGKGLSRSLTSHFIQARSKAASASISRSSASRARRTTRGGRPGMQCI